MKRTAQVITKELDKIKNDIETLKNKKRVLKTELENIEKKESELITVPYDVYRQLAIKDDTLWVSQRIKNVYDCRNDCQIGGDCWYQGNMDRLSELEIYNLEDMPDFCICNVCLQNNFQKHLFEDENNDTIEVHLQYYAPEIQKIFLENALYSNNCEECNALLKISEKNITWRALTCECLEHKEYHNIHPESTCTSIALCEKCNVIFPAYCVKCNIELKEHEKNQEWFQICSICEGKEENDGELKHLCSGGVLLNMCDSCAPVWGGGLAYGQG